MKSSVIITDYVTSSLAFIMFCVSVRNSLIKGCKVLDEVSRFDSQLCSVAVCPYTLQLMQGKMSKTKSVKCSSLHFKLLMEKEWRKSVAVG